jgi:hypothetical protein
MPRGTRQARIEAGRRQARWLGAAAFVLAALSPVYLFHGVVEVLAQQPRWWDLHYLSGWLPWALIAAGLAFLLPVAYSAGMNPDSRFFPRARGAYAGWGITLYLLGFLLAWQVANIQSAAFAQ